jgi:recombinational DNA repair protein RecR
MVRFADITNIEQILRQLPEKDLTGDSIKPAFKEAYEYLKNEDRDSELELAFNEMINKALECQSCKNIKSEIVSEDKTSKAYYEKQIKAFNVALKYANTTQDKDYYEKQIKAFKVALKYAK